MSFLTRPASLLRSAAVRPAISMAPRARQQIRWGTTDYGSGSGDPAAEQPKKQGQNPSEHVEHPGPPPPKTAKGQSSSSPNNDESQSQSQSASQSSSSGGKSGSKGAQPKILSESAPPKENQKEDVKRHNEEMEQRTERAHEQASKDGKDEKVPKKFWSGQGGRDSEP